MDLQHIDRDFGKAVRARRIDRELSQEDLAQRVSARGYALSQATVGKIERGDRKVTIGEAEAIAAALATNVRELVLGPSYVTREILMSRLNTLRRELIDAVAAFDSGRALVAFEAVGLSDYDRDWLRDSVLESAEEVIADYRKDVLVENEARRRRDEMDGPHKRSELGGLYGEYEAKFGDTVSGLVNAHAAEVITRRASQDDG